MENERETDCETVEEARIKAEQIVMDAKTCARQIHAASLDYVDDMLVEVSLAAKRAKESIRIILEQTMEDLEQRICIIEENQKELLKDLLELSENGKSPIRKTNYEIKVDESYVPKQSYTVKIKDGLEEKVEVHKPAKEAFEIKISEEWKTQIETMLEEQNELLSETIQGMTCNQDIEELEEPEELEDGFKPGDFNLDEEYFMWLEENK